MHSLDLPCFYLQFDQMCHTYWTPFASNVTSSILKSKSSIVITNLVSFIGIATIVYKKEIITYQNDHVHGLAKLLSNNEQEINTLDI